MVVFFIFFGFFFFLFFFLWGQSLNNSIFTANLKTPQPSKKALTSVCFDMPFILDTALHQKPIGIEIKVVQQIFKNHQCGFIGVNLKSILSLLRCYCGFPLL